MEGILKQILHVELGLHNSKIDAHKHVKRHKDCHKYKTMKILISLHQAYTECFGETPGITNTF